MAERSGTAPNRGMHEETAPARDNGPASEVGQVTEEDVTTTEARQAVEPHRVRYMLIGVPVVVLGFLAVYFLIR